MAKLATARESRMYCPGRGRIRAEYMNAGLYLFATVVLGCGFAAQYSSEPKSGLALMLIALILIVLVNVHDFVAHLAGIDFRLTLMRFDWQLVFVEFAVPLVQAVGCLLFFFGILFIFIQEEKRSYHFRVETHALNMLIAGPMLWLLGSIHNSCQIYERSDGHVQILQQSVHIPFLVGSTVFMVGAVLNSHEQSGVSRHGIELLGNTWIRFGLFGSLLFVIGGLTNVIKVFKMLQINALRLEKLRGGAQERLVQQRDGQTPLIQDEERRKIETEAEERRKIETEAKRTAAAAPLPTPYKDVLIGRT